MNQRLIIFCLLCLGILGAGKPSLLTPPYLDQASFGKGKTVAVKGRISLAENTRLRCLLKGKITTARGERTELLDVYYPIVDKVHNWSVEIPADYNSKWESFEFEISPTQNDNTKEFYYLDILSSSLSERRAQCAQFLWASFNDALPLDTELNQLISAVEQAKQNRPEIERLIKTPLGIYKSKEEALADLIRKWTAWEGNWHNQLNTLTKVVRDYNHTHFICPASQVELQRYLEVIQEQYLKYRQRLLGNTEIALSHHIIAYPAAWYRNPDESKNYFTRILTKELSSKFIKDMTAWMEHLILTHTSQALDSNERYNWPVLKQSAGDYIQKLRVELTAYEAVNIPFSKITESAETVEMITQLIDKLSQNENIMDCQNFIIGLKNKLEILYDELR